MKKTFTCPVCGEKQPTKKIFFLSNLSKWECKNCKSIIKPKSLSNKAWIFGFLSFVLPAYYSIFILKKELLESMSLGLLFGIIAYLISLVYFYKTIEFEEE